MQRETGGRDAKAMISKGYQLLLFRTPSEAKLAALESLYEKALTSFRNDAVKTCEMIGENNQHNNPETAALVVVANALLNLDEAITRN
jgi:hypothetical protein